MMRYKVWLRSLFLGLFILSMLGPWSFDQLNVPAQFPCEKPSVRLQGDFCGYPMTGFGVLGWVGGGLVGALDGLLKGTLDGPVLGLFGLVYTWIIVVPFLTLGLLILKKETKRLRTLHLVACGLAGLPVLALLIAQSQREHLVHPFPMLWGIALYLLAVIGSMLFEILALRSSAR